MTTTTEFPRNAQGGWNVPAGTSLPRMPIIPAYSQIGTDCEIGDHCRIGPYSQVGAGCEIGNHGRVGPYSQIGDHCRIGRDSTIEGVVARRFLTMANVDGTGRQVLIVTDGKTARVRAGCFVGTPSAFAAKAEAQGKTLYARLIPLVAAELLAAAQTKEPDQ